MKVELDKIRLGKSALLNNIYVYIPDSKDPQTMLHKKEVTEDFRNIAIKQIDELKAENEKLRNSLLGICKRLIKFSHIGEIEGIRGEIRKVLK